MWFLGIDIGTTHVKVVGVTAEGVELDPLRTRTPVNLIDGATFHEGGEIWDCVRDLVRAYAHGPVQDVGGGLLAGVAVGSFGQEESFPVDDHGTPLTGSRAWWERWPERTLHAAAVEHLDSVEHFRTSGMRFRDNQSPDRIARLRADHPDVWAHTHRWVDFGAFVTFQLSGRWALSSTQATHSQFFDLLTLEPDQASLDLVDIEAGLFPEIAHPGTRIGALLPDALPGVPIADGAAVYVGGHDQVMAAYASSVHDGASAVDAIGTAEYVMLTSGAFALDERLHAFGADVERGWMPDQYVLGWGLPTGKILQQLADRFVDGDFDRLMAAIDVDLPSPPQVHLRVNDLHGRAEDLFDVEGVEERTRPDDIVRACLTDLSVQIRDTVRTMAAIAEAPLDSIALTGSLFQRSELVRHRERLWNLPLRVSPLREAAAVGAAELARASHTRATSTVGDRIA
ncbi:MULTISPECIES: FGGY family carbohydrate kinase [unclassified Microbacterium]|uniref:FGGY family carbohydrate kinase n=1 Tax=unclassified Microbacterium TaxID=2609290 RepID=UPI0016052231|nr:MULTISPECIES: FGGY family carbohydrate kinase [unclassified Microbacterium]QNA93571.1 hypothetical protein G4G29_17010 [Microbacterium sp. Se63.02b]QYM63828.1 hypothetical protein K1X59_17080 [Microbacterium sp. Se5.02b]